MTDGLKDDHRQAIIDLLAANEQVEKVVLFGSRAMGTFTPTSDVDLALFGDALTLRDEGRLLSELDELTIPQRVDIVRWSSIESRELLRHIEREGIVWYERGRVGEWKKVKLGPNCSKIGSGATPRGGSKVYLDQGEIAFIRSQNVYNEGFSDNGLTYIRTEDGDKLTNVSVEKNDVLLNITGDSVARCCQVDPEVLPARVNQHVAIIRPLPEKIDSRFLRYFLISPKQQLYMLGLSHAGATRKALTKGMLESFHIPNPPLPTQKAIAHILGSLDDKIELNRQMNQTLEAMAQAIFKSWFIDFDPVVFNAVKAGKPVPEQFASTAARYAAKLPAKTSTQGSAEAVLGLPEEVVSLFPDGFEQSELGWIPRGWGVKVLSSVIQFVGGGTPKTSVVEYWNGSIPWFSVADAPSESDLWVIDTEKYITQIGVDNSSTKILPKGTTIITARGTVGKCALTGRPMAMNQSCYGIQPIHGYGKIFTNFTIRNQIAALQRSSHGSVFSTITRATFNSIQLADGGSTVSAAFDKFVNPYLAGILENLYSVSICSTLRDTLLPKLISGELRVPEVEAFLEGFE